MCARRLAQCDSAQTRLRSARILPAWVSALTVGAYVDDTAITSSVKARCVEDKDVDASSIRVETLNGTVMLSGFAKNATEKSAAESIAMKVKGAKSVKNEIAVRP